MKLGLNIRNFGPSAGPAGLRDWVRFAEGAGFDLAMMSDHIALTPEVNATYPAPFYDSFTTLAWLAGQTDRIELGTTVAVLPYRHPLQVARVAANIDQFSNGRFILGVGVGWSEQEYNALGVSFAERGRITDEYLAAITAVWNADTASMSGKYVEFRDIATGPPSVRMPHVPIWIGGAGRAAIRRTVEYGDAWHPINMGVEWLRNTGIPALRRAVADRGRTMPQLAPRIQLRLTDEAQPDDTRAAGEGTVEQIVADLHSLKELGAEYVVMDTNPDDPHDTRSLTEDWRILETVARHARDERL